MSDLRVRLRVLPWSVRRRVKGPDDGGTLGELAGEAGGGDDPFTAAIGLVLWSVFALLVVLPFALGLALLPLELLALALVAAGSVGLQLVGLRPWTVAVEQRVAGRWRPVGRLRRRGLRSARAARDGLRAELARTTDVQGVLARSLDEPARLWAPAGWYPDGDGERWWDGAAWTDRVRTPPTRPQEAEGSAGPVS